MNPAIADIDLVRGGVLVTFSDGTYAFFDAEFLYQNRNADKNNLLPSDE